jgi:hypothetical protein
METYLEVLIMSGNQPVKKIKVGAVTVSIWANESEKYGTQYSLGPPTKNYKKDEKWQSTTNLRASEAMNAIVCYQKAFEYLYLKDDAVSDSPI